jgi:hypothetical protein
LPELLVAVLVHTWLSAAAASNFLPGGWVLSRGITTMPPPQKAVAITGPWSSTDVSGTGSISVALSGTISPTTIFPVLAYPATPSRPRTAS